MNRLTIRGTALTLAIFLDVTFVLCVTWGLLLPGIHARGVPVLEALLPGFTWLTPGSFLLGLIEAFVYGVYVALVFVPLFNHFEAGRGRDIGSGQPTAGAEVLARH